MRYSNGLNPGVTPVRHAAVGVALLAAALLVSRDGGLLAPPVQPVSALPDAPASLLLAAGFLASSDDALYSVPFVAEDLAYTGIVRSDGFVVAGRESIANPVTVRFERASAGRSGIPADANRSRLHFYSGRDGQAVPDSYARFQTIAFSDVYPGIDARYRTTAGNLEVDFIVHPGADPDVVQIVPAGDVAIRQEAGSGDILLSNAGTQFRLHAPKAYQLADDRKQAVAVRARIDGRAIRFELGPYDRSQTLVIDPLVARFSTFVGTVTDALYDNVTSLSTDSQGNLYAGGLTQFDL